MVLTVLSVTLLFGLCLRKRSIVPNIAQSVPECLYEFVGGIMRENVGADGMKFFPFMFSVFLFVMFGNLLGLFPYSFDSGGMFVVVGDVG